MTTVVHDPENKMKIDSIFLFVSQDEHGNEGVVAAPLHNTLMPLIAADENRLKDLRPIAHRLAKMTKKKIKLIRLEGRVDLEEIE